MVENDLNWIRSKWKSLLSVVVVTLFVLSVIGVIYNQPWSKIEIVISSNAYAQVYPLSSVEIGIDVYIDGELKVVMDLRNDSTTVGIWPVKAGSHVVALDHGTWRIYRGWSGAWEIDSVYPDSYEAPDGKMDFARDCSVGPLHTKNVVFSISLPP